MVTVSLEIFGDVQVQRKLLRVGAAADLRPAARDYMKYLQGVETRQFDQQGGPGSGGWKPLKPETIRRKVAKEQDPRILHATHRLRNSLTSDGGGDAIREVSADELVFGSKTPYGKYHQSNEPRERLPRRPPVELTEYQRKSVIKIIQAHVQEAMRR